MASHGTESLPVAPYSSDLLADLHAGALPEPLAEQLWPLVRQDADAMTVIAALDAVTRTLRDTGRSTTAEESVPPEVAERIDRALASAEFEEPTTHSVTSIQPRRRIPRAALVAGIAASVAVAIALTAAVLTHGNRPETTDVTAAPPALVIDSDELDASVAYQVMSTPVPNDLTDSGNLLPCLVANGLSASSTVLGTAPVELDGRDGVMVVIARSAPAAGLTLLAVASDCGADNPGTLARREID